MDGGRAERNSHPAYDERVANTDLSLDELRRFRPEIDEPDDFDDFWVGTLAEARAAGGDVELRPADTPITEFVVEDLTFPGFAGDPIRGWVIRPRGDEARPTIVEYIGYGGGRGIPGERLAWASAGYTHVLMDTRGQGSGWGAGGDTPDPHGAGPATPGFMTRGIERPEDYYYRRLFTDAVRLLDVVGDLPSVDASRVAVTGGSQGGGISIAAAALSRVARAVLPDVPFLCCFRRAVELTPEPPFTEIAKYLAVHRDREASTFRTLSYFDGANFATRIRQPALFSVALMDAVVLPSTVFGAYNRLASEDRSIDVYAFNGHEGGQAHHWVKQARWLADRI